MGSKLLRQWWSAAPRALRSPTRPPFWKSISPCRLAAERPHKAHYRAFAQGTASGYEATYCPATAA
jgi:hypothetical protein